MKGGAYGTGFSSTRLGNTRFYSYRDPHLDQTIDRFQQAASWLAHLELDERELEGYVVSTVAGLDAPMKPRDMARRQTGWHLAGIDPRVLPITRQQVIDASLDQVRGLADTVAACTLDRPRCVVGNSAIIEDSKLDWEVVELLGSSAGQGEQELQGE